MDDGALGTRMNVDLSGRRSKPLRSMRLRPGAGYLREDVVPNVKNTSFVVRARVVVPDDGADGVLIAQGGGFDGWSVYVLDGVLTYVYNFGAVTVTHVRADVPLKPGAHEMEMRFAYDGGGLGQGGEVTLLVDGEEVGSGRVDRTVPFFFSMDQTLNVGIDRSTPVSQDYAGRRGFPYAGRIVHVDLEVGDDTVQPDSEDLAEVVLVAH